MNRVLFTLAALAFASVAQAGPIRQAVAEWREARQERREVRQQCGGCQPVPTVASQTGPVVSNGPAYRGIVLSSPVPTCTGGVCR